MVESWRGSEEGGWKMHTQQKCFARVYIMGCIACEMSHTSRRNHTNDKTTNSLKKSGANWKNLWCLNMKAQSCVTVCFL